MARRRFTDEQRIKAFVLRARRITSHSLWREHRELLEKVRNVQVNVTVTINHKTNETNYVNREEFPDEELLESLAARLRPLTLETDDLHYARVLDSIAALVPDVDFPEYVEPIEHWRQMWASVATRDESAQAYYMITEEGLASDQDLMYAWYYGDVVHADDKETEAKGLGIRERYKAAASIVTRIVECADLTLLLVRTLVDEGALTVDPELFEREVVVSGTVFETPVKAYLSEVGTPPTTHDEELDPEVWKPMSEVIAPEMESPPKCEIWWNARRPTHRSWKLTPQLRTELTSQG